MNSINQLQWNGLEIIQIFNHDEYLVSKTSNYT